MAAAKRKSIAKLCLALGLFVLAGFFRQADRVGAPLPSAAFFLLTNLIYTVLKRPHLSLLCFHGT